MAIQALFASTTYADVAIAVRTVPTVCRRVLVLVPEIMDTGATSPETIESGVRGREHGRSCIILISYRNSNTVSFWIEVHACVRACVCVCACVRVCARARAGACLLASLEEKEKETVTNCDSIRCVTLGRQQRGKPLAYFGSQTVDDLNFCILSSPSWGVHGARWTATQTRNMQQRLMPTAQLFYC